VSAYVQERKALRLEQGGSEVDALRFAQQLKVVDLPQSHGVAELKIAGEADRTVFANRARGRDGMDIAEFSLG
jgi:hypothetical protein